MKSEKHDINCTCHDCWKAHKEQGSIMPSSQQNDHSEQVLEMVSSQPEEPKTGSKSGSKMTSSSQNLNDPEIMRRAIQLYKLEEGVDSKVAARIAILRQLINEEFVAKNKQISSQNIYDVLREVL